MTMIETQIKGIPLIFETSSKVFSPARIDQGTLAMLEQVSFSAGDKVLDLGCGYGVVGILAGKLLGPEQVVLCDVSEEAIALTRINARQNSLAQMQIIQSDGLDQITDVDFTIILTNPPYHADFSVPRRFIEDGWRKLAAGGKFYMVTKRKTWYKNKFIAVFGGIRIVESEGYYIFCAEKRPVRPGENSGPVHVDHLSKKLQRKQAKSGRQPL
jgi:16S rRNA (guanine1207-N2)-methyltransferase